MSEPAPLTRTGIASKLKIEIASQIAVLQSKLKQKGLSESNSDPPATPKPKSVLSEKQKEALAADRAKRLEKLKSVSENK
jgi:hypothetical protein